MIQAGLRQLAIVFALAIISMGCLARQTYKNPSLGFAIQHPPSWTVSESGDSNQVKFGKQVVVFIDPFDSLLSHDLLGHLEVVSKVNLDSGSFVEVEQPERIRVRNYQAARISVIAKYPRIGSIPMNSNQMPEIIHTDEPKDIIVITDGVKLATIIVMWPDATTEWVVGSFIFCCD